MARVKDARAGSGRRRAHMSDMPRITAAVERVFDERLQALRQRHLVELVAKDRFYELQLEAKDREIRGWIDIVEQAGNVTQNTTNKYHVEQYINVFCKESIENISPHAIQELIDNPDNTVYQFVRLKHREGILTDPERAVRHFMKQKNRRKRDRKHHAGAGGGPARGGREPAGDAPSDDAA